MWKIRSSSTTKLDRKCIECDSRVRVTLDRSSTGQGRRESVEIWERSTKLTDDELNREVEVRDSQEELDTSKENIGRDEVHIQSGLSRIYAEKWRPQESLNFPSKIDSKIIRSELLRFVSERNEGYLDIVAGCWDSMSPPSLFDGHDAAINIMRRIIQATGVEVIHLGHDSTNTCTH